MASFEVKLDKLAIIKRLAFSNNRLLAIFHEYLVEPNQVSSVICEFNLTTIRSNLETRKFWYKNERNDFDCGDVMTTAEQEAEELYDFLGVNTLLDANISGDCRLVLPYRIIALDFVIEKFKTIAYLTTSSSKIIRVDLTENEFKVLSILSLGKLINKNIIEILINKQEKIIYVSTDESMLQINMTSLTGLICGNYKKCSNCVSDPLCFWDASEVRCSEMKQKNEVLAIEAKCLKESNSIEIKMERFEVLKGKNFVLECFRDLYEINEKLELDREVLNKRISLFKNEIELVKNILNIRIGRNGELIFLNVDEPSVYACKLDGESIMIANLSVSESVNEYKETNNIDESFDSFKKIISELKTEVEDFSQKYENLGTFFNCSMN